MRSHEDLQKRSSCDLILLEIFIYFGRSFEDFRKKRFEKEFVRKRGENLSKISINFL
jgi:hypothetical protein